VAFDPLIVTSFTVRERRCRREETAPVAAGLTRARERVDRLDGSCEARAMTCASCGTRKAKRACPALSRSICSTCCGVKRQKAIACTPDCTYLGNAEAHPPAIVQRQRERDLPMLVQMIEGLSAEQGEVLSLLQARIRMHRDAAIPPLRDSDVRDAMTALASTLETASRGILYEHQSTSVPAMRLQQDLREVLAELGEHERALAPKILAPVLRRIEMMIDRASRHFAGPSDASKDTVFLDFLERVGQPLTSQGDVTQDDAPRIVLS
jgi:hypothetical protein